MFIPVASETYIEPNTRLDIVDAFVYLGSTVLRDVSLDAEIYLRIGKASTASGKLEIKVLAVRDIRINMKINVYRTFVIMARYI